MNTPATAPGAVPRAPSSSPEPDDGNGVAPPAVPSIPPPSRPHLAPVTQLPGLPWPYGSHEPSAGQFAAQDPGASASKKPRNTMPKEVTGERALGTTLLPLARVQKIMRADKDLTGASKEAIFLIAVATEEFIKRLAQLGQKQARQEGRMTVQIKDLAVAVQQRDELNFLEDIIPLAVPTTIALDKHREQAKNRKPPVEGPGSIAEAFGKVPKKVTAGGPAKAGKGKGKAMAAVPADAPHPISVGDDGGDVVMEAVGEGPDGITSSTRVPSIVNGGQPTVPAIKKPALGEDMDDS